MIRIFPLFGFCLLAWSLTFAEESNSPLESPKPIQFDLGVSVDGAYGMWNAKLEKEHFDAPQFGFGVSALWGYGHFAFRISGIGKYQAIYASEGTQATINEGFWRFGGGGAFRIQQNARNGFWTELGSHALFAVKKEITLVENAEQNILWQLKSKVQVPLEISAGYRIPQKAFRWEFALFGSYDLTEPLSLRANKTVIQAKSVAVGARISLWGGIFK